MRTLILLRHGEAEPRASSGRDADRPLTPRGREQAAQAGAALAALDLGPVRALVSAARRTRETWTAAEEAAGLPADAAAAREDLYDASAETLLAAARAGEADTVAVVAHNPGVGALAAALGDTTGAFPPGALAVFAWDSDRGAARLRLRRDPA